jgi:hypothetical protein
MKHWAAGPPLNQLLLARHGAIALALGYYEPLPWD